jgi:hypothetical protein
MTKLLGQLVISIIFVFEIIVYQHIIGDISLRQLYTPILYYIALYRWYIIYTYVLLAEICLIQ